MGKVVLLAAAKRLSSEFGYSSLQLREAIPYIREFQGKTMVVKIGGSVLHQGGSGRSFFEDIVFMTQIGMRVLLVHGGSRDLNERMRRDGIEPRLRRGERYTDLRTLHLAVEVFDEINTRIVRTIKSLGGRAIGFRAGRECVVRARRKAPDPNNFVGEVVQIDVDRIRALKDGYVPVVTCIGVAGDGQLFNINADEVASRAAEALRAEKLILVTDVDGVKDANGKLISTLTYRQATRLLAANVIHSGMIPKVRVCLQALRAGVRKAHIINGAREGSLLCEVLSDSGVGTEIVMAKPRCGRRIA